MPQAFLIGLGSKSSHYLALGAAGALLTYAGAGEAGSGYGLALPPGSLRVRVLGTGAHMRLDEALADVLEVGG